MNVLADAKMKGISKSHDVYTIVPNRQSQRIEGIEAQPLSLLIAKSTKSIMGGE